MAGHSDEHGHGGHGGPNVGHWMETHLSGIVMPFGKKMEKVFDRNMHLIVNGVPMMAAKACLVVLTPVLLVEFALHFVRL